MALHNKISLSLRIFKKILIDKIKWPQNQNYLNNKTNKIYDVVYDLFLKKSLLYKYKNYLYIEIEISNLQCFLKI